MNGGCFTYDVDVPARWGSNINFSELNVQNFEFSIIWVAEITSDVLMATSVILGNPFGKYFGVIFNEKDKLYTQKILSGERYIVGSKEFGYHFC